RSPLHASLRKPRLPRTADAFHALLSVVPCEGEARVAASRDENSLPVLPLGGRHGFLAPLPMVYESVGPMSAPDERVQLFLGASDRVEVDREFPQGLVALRTIRSPEKETANEDAA